MDDSDESVSEASDTILEPFDDDELPGLPNEAVEEDLANEIDDLLSDEGSIASLNLADGPSIIKPRPYQLEMVRESLKRNIIVAMDTGSGKTHVAVMRMQHELERIPPNQFIWFLAPTVSLCSQQYEYIQSQISAVQVKFLSGADDVDRWTEQSLWDAILKNMKIVVSTYQILSDALTHAFVSMESLALIVFDEAHNCVGKHAGAKLMQSFYHKRKATGLNVPHILGLTASPVMRSDPLSVTKIEETLDAICRTPTMHRAELRLQVKLPVLSQVFCERLTPADSLSGYTRAIESLGKAFASMKIFEDPYIISLIHEDTDKSRRKLEKVRLNHKTWCRDQMKSFYGTTLKICSEAGAWAADYYVAEVVSKVTKSATETESMGIWDVDITTAEKQYLARTIKGVEITRSASSTPAGLPLVTDKVRNLVEILTERAKSPIGTFSGIIFVQERALAAVLAQLLSIHPQTRHLFQVKTIVGSSTYNARARNIGELMDIKSQENALSLFKSGKINLVVATSVLEEGIDVPACNVVICFQKPANLKSFVQRRGRARQRDSELILLLDEVKDKLAEWQQLEANMRKLYEDEMRTLNEVLLLEDAEEQGTRTFEVEKTGALLDLDNAVAHLYHFAATLPVKEYVDLRPEFICSESEGGLIRASVILPLSVNEKVRTAESLTAWKSEKNAIKDAAFEAYVALYHAGLVNGNLLPLLRHDEQIDELTSTRIQTRAAIVKVSQLLNPWVDIAREWGAIEPSPLHQTTISLGDLAIRTYLPIEIPDIPPFHVYWDSKTEFVVDCSKSTTVDGGISDMAAVWDDTWSILQATFGYKFTISEKRLIMPFSANLPIPLRDQLGCHTLTNETPFSQISGLIRDKLNKSVAYTFNEFLPSKPQVKDVRNPYPNYHETPDEPHLSLTRLPRRSDFLHTIITQSSSRSEKQFSTVLPISRCTLDNVPFNLVQFGLLIPSILHRIAVCLIANILSTTLLEEIHISDLSLVLTAISASSANEVTNYQRLEFLGDSILKLCTSVQLTAEYPLWHEGYLSAKKDRLVSNSRLSRAAIELGLDSFIITKPFTGLKWRPLSIEDLLDQLPSESKRDMSTKVLADVVEALIGVAMVNGGIPKALSCLQLFLPELTWLPLSARRLSLYRRAPHIDLPTTLEPLEELLGYKFKKKSLLVEAMTHASYKSGSQSLERFEFLGDAILDYLVVTAMYSHEAELSHVQMHHLRTSLVNADFLAFTCMEWQIKQELVELEPDHTDLDENGLPKFKPKTTSVSLPLWRFLRHSTPKLGAVQHATATRHGGLRDQINDAIQSGSHYPWALLARLQANKFFSDMVESLLGAVWIDCGSFDTCTEIIERMGIMPYFRRILKDNVHTLHPKEELGILADTETVRYRIESKVGEERVEYLCTVFVGEREIVRVDGGVSKEEVKTKAAEMAVEIIKAEKVAVARDQLKDDDVLVEKNNEDVGMED